MAHARFLRCVLFGSLVSLWLVGCARSSASFQEPTFIPRESKIPESAVKILPATDDHPPEMLSGDYEQPIPLPGAVNTAGAEDSPFITPDGNTLFFFFTPDMSVPAEKQLLDGVTGIYVSKFENNLWRAPERVLLQEAGKVALDGCEFVLGNMMWFCSAREGYQGTQWFTAEQVNGMWQNVQLSSFDPAFQVGELHMSNDGAQLYFASNRPGGKGGLDIWVSNQVNGSWQAPTNLAFVNTEDDEGWPALSPDGQELWFYRQYSIWRSEKVDGRWEEAEKIVSSLAGEPSLDQRGNLYFVHHFYQNDRLVEADIYFARKK